VNTLSDHIEYVECHPFDKCAAFALVDRLVEDHGGTLIASYRFVAKMRWPGRQARFLAQAARAVRRRNLDMQRALDGIRRGAMPIGFIVEPILLVSSFREPVVMRHPTGGLIEPFESGYLTIGARELLRRYHDEQRRSKKRRAAVRSFRKRGLKLTVANRRASRLFPTGG